MSANCPWCEAPLDAKFVHALTSAPEPCPECGKPLKQSLGQVVSTVVMLLPLIAAVLYVAKMLHDAGTPFGAMFLLLVGLLLGSYVQQFLPAFVNPARGPVLRCR